MPNAAAHFPLGQLVATPGALDAAPMPELLAIVGRHARGDWGDPDAEDRRANERALATGERLLSAYTVGETRVWVITEADRSATTVLLPEDY
jgi:hypothetical protein